jgi:surface polysaccharide O-acyltransferase-like enzyme
MLMVLLLQTRLPTNGISGWLWKRVGYIGQHSYPIYVFHLWVLERLQAAHLVSGRGALAIYFTSSIAVGVEGH